MPRRDTTGNRAAMQSVLLAAALLVVVPALGVLLVKWLDVPVPQGVGVGAAVVVGIGLLLVLVATVANGYRARATTPSGSPTGSARALLALSLLLAFVALAVYVLGSVLSVKTEPRRSRRCPAPRSRARRRSPPGDDAVEVRMTLDQLLVAGSWMRIVAFNPGGVASGRDQLVGGP